MVKVSVILPSLNVKKYIDSCLESVVNQTLEDIEIICVDAGSTDGTLETIKAYVNRDPRVRLIVSDKKSYGYQMNLGISSATGTYIGIVETDDFVPQNMYADLYKTAIEQHAEVVKADFYRFYSVDGGYKCVYERLDPTDTYYNRVLCPAEQLQVFRLKMNTWSGIYLRSFLTENNIAHNESPGASYQDNGFWFKTFCCAKRVYFVDNPYYMNRRDNADSSVKSSGKVYSMSDEWEHIYNWLREDSRRFNTFIGVFVLRKYHNLMFTYNRIAKEFRREYIKHMSEEFHKHIYSGEYDKEHFMLHERNRFTLIAHTPLVYQQLRESGYSYRITCRLCQLFYHQGSALKIIHRADKWLHKIALGLSFFEYYGLRRTVNSVKWRKLRPITKSREI